MTKGFNDVEYLVSCLVNIVRNSSTLMTTRFEILQKGSQSNIVTANDKAVQDYLIFELEKLLPGSGFMCEEDDFRKEKKYTWIIDPIDGTTNYSRGIDACAISVALRQSDVITIGVVYLPYKDEMFTAIRGKGAYLNGERINVSNRTFEESLLCTSFCAYHKENLGICSQIINETYLQCNDIRRFGSAASELCYVAKGCCELFFEYELYPWDYAAASLILREAGGKVLDLKGKVLSYQGKTGIIAANSIEHLNRLLEIVVKYISS